jgi:dTDP-4-amino-4,6-dideoxygalactose transaminase
VEHVYHQYTIRIQGGAARRDAIQKSLAERGVASTVYYPLALHQQPMFKQLGYAAGSFPIAEQAAAEVLSLPIYPELTPQQIHAVTEGLRHAVAPDVGVRS